MPAQLLVRLGVVATCRPLGSVSVKVMPVAVTPGLLLVSVKVSVVMP